MARNESDREDLLREATALVERAELRVTGFAEPIVVGFRRDGAASVFFGADPVYQFNAAGQLRRAHVAGLLYKAEQGQLVSLRRERTESAVNLIRRELSGNENAAFLAAARIQLGRLREAVVAWTATVLRQVPADGELMAKIRRWLDELPEHLSIAASPNAR